MRRLVVTSLAIGLALLPLGCGDDAPDDGFQPIASGDTYGEWELSAEYRDGAWTGCLRMDDDEDPMCDDPDGGLVVFQDRTGAVYGGAPTDATVLLDGEPIDLIDDRFFVAIDGFDPGDVTLAP